MLTDCPDPREVADFHFLQLRSLRTAKVNKNISEKSGNILAAASKYGLLFIGTEGGFNVIKLETILTLDEDKENRSIVENYSYDFVPCGTPVTLAVNATQTMLAVCVKCASNIIINLYSLSTNFGSGSIWQPFCTNASSPSGAEVWDFVWNPAVEGWYVVCFSDGSLQIHEVSGMSIKIVGALQRANAVSVCWSPKGKQLVAGKQNGTFTQYKPNLTEVKTIPPPGLEESLVSITSICWIANTLFAVVYVVGDTPNLFIVSTPKDSACVYTNFYDVCLGNNCAPHQRYLLHLEPSWKILVCASLDSIEIAVLGDMPNWVQWDLKEDGKALLPGKDGATHAVGMTVMYSAQRQLVISESESYPPMPILFLLTNNGLLVSFHMINASSAAASLIYAPLPLENVNTTGDVSVAGGPPVILKQAPSNHPVISSTFIVRNPAAGDQSLGPENRESANIPTTQTFGMGESSATMSVTEQKESPHLFGNGVHVKKPEDAAISQIQKSAISGHMGITPLHSGTENQNEVQSSTQNSYMTAIISEIQSFVKELQDLKQLQSSSPTINGEEDMVSLKKYALNLHNFQKNILETMQSISSDIYTLKNVLLESFVMLEEACSRERRRNDHSYITMLKERALDPITAKRMQKMNQHYQYLNTQMQEVSDKLDQDWINLCSTKKKSNKSNLCISSTEAIYKTIVNNQKIIHNLRKKVEMLMKKSEERKLRNTTKSASWGRYHKKSMQEDLSRLADEFLQVKITHLEEGEPTVTKKLSSESQTVIKAFLKQSSIVTVRPTAVYSPSQSRLLSNTAPSEDFSGSDHEKDVSAKEINTPTQEKEVSKLISPPSEAQMLKINSKMTFSFERTPNQSAPIGPVYEPITPPDVVNSTVPVNKSSTTSNIPVPSLINEKQPEQQAYNQPLFKGTNTVDSSVSSSTERDQRIGSNILSNFKSNIEGPPNISCPLNFNQTSSENVSATSTSLFYPKTLSFASSTQKVTENATSKPLAVSSNTMVSSVVSSFQFMSSFGPKKEIAFSTSPPNNSTVSSNKINSQLESKSISESSQLCQPEVSLSPLTTNTLNVPASQSSSFSMPMTNPSQISGPPSFISPETKNSTLITASGGRDQSDVKSNVGFFFQKPSEDIDEPDILAVKKDATSESSSQTTAEKISVLGLTFNKTDSVDSKSSGIQALNSQCSDVDKSVITQPLSILPNQTSFATVQKTEDLVTANSQPTITNTVSNFLDLKQSLSPSEVSTSEPSVVSTVVTSNSLIETAQSIVPLPASSADITKSDFTTSVTNTVNIPQSDLATSKPSTPPMPVLSPITTTSTQILFGQNTVVTSAGNSDLTASKTESSSTSVFVKPLFGQSSAETSSFFGAANTYGQTSVTQSTSFGQTATNSTFPSASGGFFSQMSSTFGTPAAATSTTNSSDFNSQTSTFSFGKPAFGQTTGTFGLAKSFFGQNTTPFTQAGSSTSFSFNQNSSSMFGQGSFFSGLGGKPSEENASKNVFGLSSNVKLNTDTSSLFRNSSVTSFGTVNSSSFSTPGSFSSGGGSVAQAGFGSFQQNTVPQTGFVSAPSFGGAPAFGSPPAFGGSPTFGSGNPLSPSVFGQQVSSNFSTFANASSPTFGSLASQTPSFGNSSGGFASQGTGFGSPSVFGGSSFGGQSSSFGNPGSPPSNSSAFTQWRN